MSSNVEVNHHRGEVNINDHTGSVSLNLDGSSARLAHLKGNLTIQGKANEVAVEDVDGEAHLNGEFQESVRLVRISKTVSFHSSRTDMEFARLDGRLDLDSGDVRVSIPPNTAIKVEARTREGEISSDFDEIKVENNNKQSSASGAIGSNG